MNSVDPMPNPKENPEAWEKWVQRQPGVIVYENPDPKPWSPDDRIRVREGISIREILGRGEFDDDDDW